MQRKREPRSSLFLTPAELANCSSKYDMFRMYKHENNLSVFFRKLIFLINQTPERTLN